MSKLDLPSSRHAVIEDVDGKPKIAEIPMPELIPGTILIKTEVVALNPSDYKMGTSFPCPGAVVGNDFAGTVIAVAEGTETEIKPGDVVFGGSHGSNPGNPESGAFATYIRAPADVVLRLYPESRLTKESAATFGVALATCSLSLWGHDALGLQATPYEPSAERFPVLVYGGSTATGTVAIQLLKLSGLDPIATCSPRNFELVRAAGATAVFDYADPDSIGKIKEYTGGQLKNVLDCISDPQSVDFCYNAVARVGGRYVSLEHVPDELLAKRRAIDASFVMAYEIVGEEVKLPGAYGKPADNAKSELGAHCFAMFEGLLREGKLRPHPIQLLENGLPGVLDGLALLKSGSVSGRKLVAVLSP